MKFVVVDVQGYVINSTFTVKELAIYDGKYLKSFLFKPTLKYSSLYTADRKTYHNIHGISYSAGNVEYSEINNILENNLSSFDIIFVKGQVKVDVLRKYFAEWTHIVNLENSVSSQVPQLEPTKENCDNHKLKYSNCSIRNVYVVSDYIYKKLIE
ncbi:hypothetical protein ABEB36_000379 [Hypothenemus hampei]|uniref:Uncharacterized protein n=1 Tax=Hypothenemus hampei TaxID=57062 RepID=A0ABD1FBR3_HYPHA